MCKCINLSSKGNKQRLGSIQSSVINSSNLGGWAADGGSVPRKYALFFHRLSILERATDHKWVGFKCNGPVNFFSERRYFKYNTCVSRPAKLHLPPTKLHLLSLVTPPPPSQAPLLSRGRDISGSGAPTGVFSPEKGDPSDKTGSAGIFDRSSRGRIRSERRRQEMTNSDSSPSPPRFS